MKIQPSRRNVNGLVGDITEAQALTQCDGDYNREWDIIKESIRYNFLLQIIVLNDMSQINPFILQWGLWCHNASMLNGAWQKYAEDPLGDIHLEWADRVYIGQSEYLWLSEVYQYLTNLEVENMSPISSAGGI